MLCKHCRFQAHYSIIHLATTACTISAITDKGQSLLKPAPSHAIIKINQINSKESCHQVKHNSQICLIPDSKILIKLLLMISKKSQQTFKKTNVVYFCISFYDYDCFFVFFLFFFFFVDAVYTVYEKQNGINKENISLDYIVFVN